ncbi:hypothetical protein KCP75_04860 [Salmonella enterica subsp. enterica]|nr:hypothetical protein KCP75_04860 [Salmonella enterica subsp. enterica]
MKEFACVNRLAAVGSKSPSSLLQQQAKNASRSFVYRSGTGWRCHGLHAAAHSRT